MTTTVNKQELKYGTIAYWKERINKASDLMIVGTNISTNRNWDKGHYNYFKIFVVIDGQNQEMQFTENETKENLKRLPLKKKDGYHEFHTSVLGMDRYFKILYSLSSILFEGDNSVNGDSGYVIFDKFPSARRHN